MEKRIPTFEEFEINEAKLPKLGAENMAAAEAVLQALKTNPGMNNTEIQTVMGQNKKVTKGYREPGKLHYMNYQNIFKWLYGTFKIKHLYDGKRYYYYLTTQEIPPQVIQKYAEYAAKETTK